MSMKITDKINALDKDEPFFSFEFFPPKTEHGMRNLYARLGRMSLMGPLFVTVTWGAGGTTAEKSVDLAITCQKELGLTTCLHLTCTNTTKKIDPRKMLLQSPTYFSAGRDLQQICHSNIPECFRHEVKLFQ